MNYGNQWWYYGPQHNWMYYQNNSWAPYDAASYTGAGIPAAPLAPAGYGSNPDSWRYVYNGNRWWYYTPQLSWMQYTGNQWAPYQATGPAPRNQTGYRGNYGEYIAPGNPPQVPVDPNARNPAAAPEQSADRAPALPNDPRPVPGDGSPQPAPRVPNDPRNPQQVDPNTGKRPPAAAQSPARPPAPQNDPQAPAAQKQQSAPQQPEPTDDPRSDQPVQPRD